MLIIDITPYAIEVDNYFGHCYADNITGFFMRGHPFPTFFDGAQYFTHKGLQLHRPILDLSQVKEEVYDHTGVPVATAAMMCRFDTLFSRKPVASPMAVKLIHTFISRFFENFCNYTVTEIEHHVRYIRLFRPEYAYLLNSVFDLNRFSHPDEMIRSNPGNAKCGGEVDAILDQLTLELTGFAGDDRWLIYHTTFNNFFVRITKGEDYRISQYAYLQQELHLLRSQRKDVTDAPQRCFEISEKEFVEKFVA